MKLLIKQAKIIDPTSNHHGKRMDILVRNDRIIEVKRSVKAPVGTQIIKSADLHVSPGWVDIGAQLGEPGFEHRETLQSGAAAAARGGYTAVACFPNTSPALHSKSEVSFIRQRSEELGIRILPIGAISKNCDGADLAEFLDMHSEGAVAFSDGENPVSDSGLVLRALLYARKIGGLIIQFPFDKQIVPGGVMHEGRVSTSLGLRGIPVLSESMLVRRDLRILEYTTSRLHFHSISSDETVAILREARKRNLHVSSSVPALNLLLENSVLEQYEERYKVLPPLREEADRKSLIQGLKDGTIDCVVSNHVPRDVEEKHRELALSAFGSTGLETAFAIAHTATAEMLDLDVLVGKFSTNPRRILDLHTATIDKDLPAELTLFDPSIEWQVDTDRMASLARNEAVAGYTLQGKALGVVVKGRKFIHGQG